MFRVSRRPAESEGQILDTVSPRIISPMSHADAIARREEDDKPEIGKFSPVSVPDCNLTDVPCALLFPALVVLSATAFSWVSEGRAE